MSLFFWKKNKVIDIFASNLANEFFSAIQPEVARSYFSKPATDKREKKMIKNIDDKIRDIIKKIEQFRASNSLGVYGKARLHLKFTERLKDLGYDNHVATKINEHIMLKTP